MDGTSPDNQFVPALRRKALTVPSANRKRAFCRPNTVRRYQTAACPADGLCTATRLEFQPAGRFMQFPAQAESGRRKKQGCSVRVKDTFSYPAL